MTVETYLLFVAPLLLLAFASVLMGVIEFLDRRSAARLVAVRAHHRNVSS